MATKNQEKLIANAINSLTEEVSNALLKKFLKLPEELQINIVLIKSAQLLLANVLCQIASDKEELEKIVELQGIEMKELIFNCAFSGFSDKFEVNKH